MTSDWMKFVKAHKSMRTSRGLLDLKAISKLWHTERGYDPDLRSQKQKLNRLRAMRSKYLEHATKEQYRDAIRDQKRITKDARSKSYDPGWNAGRHNTLWNRVGKYSRSSSDDVRSHLRRTFDPTKPRKWFDAMVKGIKTRSDVRNPYAVVTNIWNKLTPAKKASIKAREAKGEQFKYDLPVPDDRATRGTGTVRMVKPFKLVEVQVNLSVKDYLAALKSGLFSKMKRNDGTTALVSRCKSNEKNVNVFVDPVTKT